MSATASVSSSGDILTVTASTTGATSGSDGWPASWNVFSVIFTLFMLFSSIFSLLVMYDEHRKWCKLKFVRLETLRGTECVTVVCPNPPRNDDCASSPPVNKATLQPSGTNLLCPIRFKYELWPALNNGTRTLTCQSAELHILYGQDESTSAAPTLLASTEKCSLSVRLRWQACQQTSKPHFCWSKTLTLPVTIDSGRTCAQFELWPKLALPCKSQVWWSKLQTPSRAKLVLCFSTDDQDCTVADERYPLQHKVILYGVVTR